MTGAVTRCVWHYCETELEVAGENASDRSKTDSFVSTLPSISMTSVRRCTTFNPILVKRSFSVSGTLVAVHIVSRYSARIIPAVK
jgi:hypothetical protein